MINSLPLDRILREKPNVIKVDCEGREYEVFKGMKKILFQNGDNVKSTKIIIELNPSFTTLGFLMPDTMKNELENEKAHLHTTKG